VKLLLDENLSSRQAANLRQLGYDAVSAAEVGLSGQPDNTIREFAIQDGRVPVTLDSDFADLTRFPTAGTPGVLRLKIHPPTEEKIRQQLKTALELLKGKSLEGCMAASHREIVRIRS